MRILFKIILPFLYALLFALFAVSFGIGPDFILQNIWVIVTGVSITAAANILSIKNVSDELNANIAIIKRKITRLGRNDDVIGQDAVDELVKRINSEADAINPEDPDRKQRCVDQKGWFNYFNIKSKDDLSQHLEELLKRNSTVMISQRLATAMGGGLFLAGSIGEDIQYTTTVSATPATAPAAVLNIPFSYINGAGYLFMNIVHLGCICREIYDNEALKVIKEAVEDEDTMRNFSVRMACNI